MTSLTLYHMGDIAVRIDAANVSWVVVLFFFAKQKCWLAIQEIK